MTEIVETRFLRKPEPSRWAHHECQTCGAFVSDTAAHARWHGALHGVVGDVAQVEITQLEEAAPVTDTVSQMPPGFGMSVDLSTGGWPRGHDDAVTAETKIDVETQSVRAADATESDHGAKASKATAKKPSKRRSSTRR